MKELMQVIAGFILFFALIILADQDNPCSQFGRNQERCSQR